MKAELKKRWVEALRSGWYRQGRGCLRRNNKGADEHCCLGVLCDLVDPTQWSPPDEQGRYLYLKGEVEAFLASTLVTEDVGLGLKEMGVLCSMNDGMGPFRGPGPYTFPEIADHIEANIPTEEDSVV
jgi:hypothetical protein